jgi:hypothetical protein
MTDYSRRQFLVRLGGAAAALLAGGKNVLKSAAAPGDTRPFEFLVVGDSLVWGGGLREEQKFYTLTRDWLQAEVFGGSRPVNLKVKAHSGATLTLHEAEARAFEKAGRDERQYYEPEVNVAFPSAKMQLDIASSEYGEENSKKVDLIMLSGGLADISTAGILNPFGDDDVLRRDIEKYLSHSTYDVLRHSGRLFPNAMVAVIGYFPMLSPKTPAGKLFNATLESYNFPGPLKPVANNVVTRLFFKFIRKNAIKRSRLWFEESTSRMQEAVAKFNSEGGARAVFIKTPVNEDTCFETPNSFLFRMGKKGRVEDFLYDERKAQCARALPELKTFTGVDYPVRFCEIASVGHPNIEGSKAYAESIKTVLGPLLGPRAPNIDGSMAYAGAVKAALSEYLIAPARW